jgi:hypothetical protein
MKRWMVRTITKQILFLLYINNFIMLYVDIALVVVQNLCNTLFPGIETLHPGSPIVLIVFESGYSPSNTPNWITNLQPQLALLSVAARDRDEPPDP